ncbi:Unknown protein [Striga hermonthica]|uniref:DNA-directed RNA polymerase III subunit n=1 Tax=Striga hermonthica TaxID=68872 RepID=A0A9N7MNC4_STRHE|nr:Unknown protein [Striga hermonthica]
MSYRGRGRGRGWGRGYGGFGGQNKQASFELFPEIEGLGTAEYTTDNRQLMKWSRDLHKFWVSSPYYYEDRRQRHKKTEKPDIEKYSDKVTRTTKAKQQLGDLVPLSTDNFPAELAEGERKGKPHTRKIRWNPELGQDVFDKFEKLDQENENAEKKENEEEEEEDEENIEDEGEYSDEGDYEQAEDFDDDEDDFNPVDDDNDEPLF